MYINIIPYFDKYCLVSIVLKNNGSVILIIFDYDSKIPRMMGYQTFLKNNISGDIGYILKL